MADDNVVLNAATRALLQSLQSVQSAAQLSLKQAAQNEQAVADLLEQAADALAAVTPTRRHLVNIEARLPPPRTPRQPAPPAPAGWKNVLSLFPFVGCVHF